MFVVLRSHNIFYLHCISHTVKISTRTRPAPPPSLPTPGYAFNIFHILVGGRRVTDYRSFDTDLWHQSEISRYTLQSQARAFALVRLANTFWNTNAQFYHWEFGRLVVVLLLCIWRNTHVGGKTVEEGRTNAQTWCQQLYLRSVMELSVQQCTAEQAASRKTERGVGGGERKGERKGWEAILPRSC